MGLFDIFKKAAAPQKPEALSVSCPAGSILAPVAGKAIALEKVSDMVFNSGAMGKGCGIEPSEEVVYAPVSGTLTAAGAPNYHAVGITGDDAMPTASRPTTVRRSSSTLVSIRSRWRARDLPCMRPRERT